MSQLSPGEPTKALSIEKLPQDVLLNDIMHFSKASGTNRLPVHAVSVMGAPQDRGSRVAERCETLLDGEKIACFDVGGEKRLCFPQVLHAVFQNVKLDEINRAMTDLHIHNSRCTSEQVEVLKVTGVLPVSSTSCGLITKSDAERLANFLVHSRKPRPKILHKTPEIQKRAIPVKHRCFGGAKGYLYPNLYQSASSDCIECDDCKGVFPPDKFVLHSHQYRGERRACHWGFDSGNWRAYVHLHREAEESEEMQKLLDDVKQRFSTTNRSPSQTTDLCLKRKAEEVCSHIHVG